MTKKSSPLPKPVVAYPALIGGIVKQQREMRRITQSTVAAALGLTQSGYSRLESGDSVMNLSQLRIVAGLFGMAPSDLMTQADRLEQQLRLQGVDVAGEKPDNSAAIVIGLGILAAVLLGQ